MSQSKPSLLIVFVLLILAAGAVAYLFVLKPSESVPTPPPVERLSEIEVNLPDDKRAEFEQTVADLTTQITDKEAAGAYALDLYFLRANAYQRLGKLQLAFADYTVVTSGDPGNETAWNNMGDIVIDMGDPMAAEDYYKKAIEQDPSEIAYNKLYRYYTSYRMDDRTDQLIPLLKQALIDNPESSSFYVKLGRLYVAQGDIDQALSAYRQAAVLAPDSEEIKEELRKTMAL